MSQSLFAQTALQLARSLQQGDLSAIELVEHSLDRIAKHDGELGAFVEICAERARKEAQTVDAARKAGNKLPLFAGVPVGIKDLHAVAFMHLRMGSAAYRHLVVPIDDSAVKSLRRAGFIVVGKTSTSEFGILPICETAIHPPTRNPFDPTRTACGSSGGSAAAVGSGLVPIALGGDGGGSIRIPASACGLIGYKPSRGRIPSPFAKLDKLNISTLGALASDIDDAFAFSLALRREDPSRPLPSPRPSLRIRFAVDAPIGQTDAAIAKAVRNVAERLRVLGHDVTEAPGFAGGISEFLPIWMRAAMYTPVLFDRYTEPVTQWLRRTGRAVSLDQARSALVRISQRIDEWFGPADLWLLPTLPATPMRVGQFASASPEDKFAGTAQLGYFTAVFNASGHPAVSLPCSLDDVGIPIGVQLVGRRDSDEALLATARTLGLPRLFPSRHF